MPHVAPPGPAEIEARVASLVERNRLRCFWYNREDWVPSGRDEMIRALRAIQRHGDLEAFRAAGEILAWL